MAVDRKDGFILGGHVTPAHVADTSEFDRLLGEVNLAPDSLVIADKGYSAILKERNYIDGIMHEANPLPYIQQQIHHQHTLLG